MALERVEMNGDPASLREAVEAVHRDHAPRIIERDGKALAVIVSADEYGEPVRPRSSVFKERLLAIGGAWHEVDGEALIKQLYDERHAAPPSPYHEL